MDDKDKLKQAKIDAARAKVASLELVRELSGDSEWNLLEQILQDIMSIYIIENPEKKVSVKQLIVDLEAEIKKRYANDDTARNALLDAVPSDVTIGKWIKKPKWEEAVWLNIRAEGLFTKERRSKMINSLFDRGCDKSDAAAKIWLTLSGDYSEKMDITTDKTLEKFREINEILHKKK